MHFQGIVFFLAKANHDIASMKSRDEQNKSLKDIIATMETDNE